MKSRVTMLLLAGACVFTFFSFKQIQTEKMFSLDSIYISKSFVDDNSDNIQETNYSIKISLPFISDYVTKDVRDEINNDIIKNAFGDKYMNISPSEAAALFVQDKAKNLSNRHNTCPNGFFIHKITKAEIIDRQILCLENYNADNINDLEQKTKYQNFDLNSGKRLQIKDLFTSEYESELKSIIINSLRSAYESKYNVPMSAYKLMQLEQNILIQESFRLSDSGLSVYCNLPKWFDNSQTETSITIPYKSLSKLFNKDYKLI